MSKLKKALEKAKEVRGTAEGPPPVTRPQIEKKELE